MPLGLGRELGVYIGFEHLPVLRKALLAMTPFRSISKLAACLE